MRITQPGWYELTEDARWRGTISIATFLKGFQFEITQVDTDGHQVIGPELPDWQYWEIPCREITELERPIHRVWKTVTKENTRSNYNKHDISKSDFPKQEPNLIDKMREGVLSLTAKCSDMFSAHVVDGDGYEVCEYGFDYVPDIMPGQHSGDYVELDIEIATGKILNWRVPTDRQLKAFLRECDKQKRER